MTNKNFYCVFQERKTTEVFKCMYGIFKGAYIFDHSAFVHVFIIIYPSSLFIIIIISLASKLRLSIQTYASRDGKNSI